MPKSYTLELAESETDAVDFHGHRYRVSEFIQKHTTCDDDGRWVMKLSEPDAWTLRDLWDDEGPLACGSAELNDKLQRFIDTIV